MPKAIPTELVLNVSPNNKNFHVDEHVQQLRDRGFECFFRNGRLVVRGSKTKINELRKELGFIVYEPKPKPKPRTTLEILRNPSKKR